MLNVRRLAPAKLWIVGAGVCAVALTGCRHIEDRIHTGSIKDSGVVHDAPAPSKSSTSRKASMKRASVRAPAKSAASGVAAAAPAQMASAQPVAKPPAAPAKPAVDNRGPVEITLDECRKLMAQGDVLAARARVETAMTKARSPYLLWLARTYDPRFLSKIKNANAKPDVQRAAALYREAADLGSLEAADNLKALTGKR